MQNNEQLIRDLFQAKGEKFLSFVDENAEFKIMPDMTMRGISEIRDGFSSWEKSFPDMKNEILNVISSGDLVAVEYIARGTHSGPLEGMNGKSTPATNKKIEIPACDIYRLKNGKVISMHAYWQHELMMRQLGLLQQEKAAA
jgi:predicted ester cyclase